MLTFECSEQLLHTGVHEKKNNANNQFTWSPQSEMSFYQGFFIFWKLFNYVWLAEKKPW